MRRLTAIHMIVTGALLGALATLALQPGGVPAHATLASSPIPFDPTSGYCVRWSTGVQAIGEELTGWEPIAWIPAAGTSAAAPLQANGRVLTRRCLEWRLGLDGQDRAAIRKVRADFEKKTEAAAAAAAVARQEREARVAAEERARAGIVDVSLGSSAALRENFNVLQGWVGHHVRVLDAGGRPVLGQLVGIRGHDLLVRTGAGLVTVDATRAQSVSRATR